MGNSALDSIKPRVSDTGVKPADSGFEHSAETVALCAGGTDRLQHFFLYGSIQQRKSSAGNKRYFGSGVGKTAVTHVPDRKDVGPRKNAVFFDKRLYNRAGGDKRRGHSAGGMPAPADVRVFAVFAYLRIIGVRRAQNDCVCRRGFIRLFVRYSDTYRSTAGISAVYTADNRKIIAFAACGISVAGRTS